MAQQSYTIPPERSVGDPQFTNIQELGTQRGRSNETAKDTENQFKFIPTPLIAILSSMYCLVVLCVLLIVPILQLAIGGAYINQCTINPNIPVYLIVTGVCGIASIVLTLVIVGAFICIFKQNSTVASVAIGLAISIIVLIIVLMSLFLFIWFIVGNVWVFGAKSNVVFDDIHSPYYCHRTLYGFAFTIIILTYVMTGISCFFSCCRSCINIKKAFK